jgi:O-antigen/teichoic acid export membrane protein
MSEGANSRLTGARTIWGLADQLVLSILGFAVMLILARTGDQSQLGLFAVANSIVVLLLSAQDSLVTRPYSIQIFKPVGTPAEHAFSALAFSFGIAALGAAIMASAAFYLFAHNSTYSGSALAIAVICPFVLLREFGRRHGLANMRMVSALKTDSIAAATAIVALLALLFTKNLTAATALLAIGLGSALGGMWSLAKSRQHMEMNRDQLRPAFLQSWMLGKWLFISQSAMQMQGYAIHWLCLLLISASATGAYAAVLSVVALANPFLYGFFNLIMLKSVRTLKNTGTGGLRQQVLRDSVVLAAIMSCFAVGIITAGGFLMKILYPVVNLQREGSVLSVLYICAIASAVGAFGGPAAIAIQGMEKARELSFVSMGVFAFGIAAAWVLIGRFGLLGTGLALLATESIGCLARWMLFNRLVRTAP